MDAALIMILIVGTIALATIPLFSIFIFSEVKKIGKEIVKIQFSINQMNTSLIHQTSRIDILNKHMGIIGSKVAPENYKKRPKRT